MQFLIAWARHVWDKQVLWWAAFVLVVIASFGEAPAGPVLALLFLLIALGATWALGAALWAPLRKRGSRALPGLWRMLGILVGLLVVGAYLHAASFLLRLPMAAQKYLQGRGFDVDLDIALVFLISVLLTVAHLAAVAWFIKVQSRSSLLAGEPATMTNPPSALLAAKIELLKEICWTLLTINLALLPAALRGTWAPNILAGVFAPILVTHLRLKLRHYRALGLAALPVAKKIEEDATD